MNESLADFSKIGKVNYNRDPLEFIHSMKDNTISGLDYVSVFGAGTSNSEFEAMTGNTMKFFPSGCNDLSAIYARLNIFDFTVFKDSRI